MDKATAVNDCGEGTRARAVHESMGGRGGAAANDAGFNDEIVALAKDLGVLAVDLFLDGRLDAVIGKGLASKHENGPKKSDAAVVKKADDDEF